MKTLVLLPMLAFWGFFGKSETSPAKTVEPVPPKVVTNTVAASASAPVPQIDTDKIVKDAVEKALKEASAKMAEKIKSEKENAEKAEKLRIEAREDAKAAETRAREDAKAARERSDKLAEVAKTEKQEMLKRIESRVFRLNHASAEEIAEKFNAMWSGDFGVNWKISKMAVAFPESNALMVTAPRLILDACEKSIVELDVEAPQVYIEARFVELGNTASHRVGIDWAMLNGIELGANFEAGYKKYDLGRGVSNYKYTEGTGTTKQGATSYDLTGTGTGGSDATIGFYNGTLSLSQMKMTLSALDASGDTKTFSNPKIIVSSGKKATVDMTTKYPNVKVSAKRTTGTTDSLDLASELVAIPGEDKFLFAKESFFSWGISLDVTPRISTNGLINVSIVPTISSLVDWVDTGTQSDEENGTVATKYPEIKVQRLVTEFKLESGTTAVIGGLSVTEETQSDNGIPILRDIPWIGSRLFGSTTRAKEQKEIIVFVTVGLVNPRSVDLNEGLPKNAILGRQYTSGQKLEPGDRPKQNMEGFDSLDRRPLEEQAKDPLPPENTGFRLKDYMPFTKDKDYRREK